MKTKLTDFNKLLKFNWFQLSKDIGFWVLAILAAISQLICFMGLYFGHQDIINYSVLTIIIPNILNSIFLIYTVSKLVINNKNNSIDLKLLCSNYSKYTIKIARFVTTFVSLLAIIFIQDIGLFFLWGMNLNQYVLVYFLCNTLISPFILLFILLVSMFMGEKLSQSVYILLSILVVFLSFGLSLITRFSIQNNVDYNNQMQTSKLAYRDQEYLLSNQPLPLENKAQWANNIIPSEWLLTYYSCLFNDFNFGIENNKLSLLTYALEPVVLE